jgi:ATP-dependent Lon protease
MKLSAFEKVIRKIMREEIDYALKRELKTLKEEIVKQESSTQQRVVESIGDNIEAEEFRAKLRAQMPPPEFNTGDDTLNSLLAETAMGSSLVETTVSNPYDPTSYFINRDYSQLMEAIEKKKEHRP